MKTHRQTALDTSLEKLNKSSAVNDSILPKNLDQLSVAARELLMDSNLEVSKVRPFFWSMVETYVDRFQIYPFDIVKAMLSYLETRDFPEEQTRELIAMLEQGYQQQHGEALHEDVPQESMDALMIAPEETTEHPEQVTTQHEMPVLDDELRELRNCLKYAAMVGELESKD